MEELSYSSVHPIVIKVCHWRQSSSFSYLSASSSIHSVPPVTFLLLLLLFFSSPSNDLASSSSPLYWSKEKKEIPSFCHTSRRLQKKKEKRRALNPIRGMAGERGPEKNQTHLFFYQPTFSFFLRLFVFRIRTSNLDWFFLPPPPFFAL